MIEHTVPGALSKYCTTPMSHSALTDADEGLHATQDHPLWQESVVLHWYDRHQGVGGWHRIGHEPNNHGGRAALWSYLFDRGGGWQYRHCGETALTSADRLPRGLAAGQALRFEYRDGAAHWSVEDGDLTAHLECRDAGPRVDPFPPGDPLAAARFPHHFEASGPVSGTVRYRDREIAVRGHGYRDHSWGARDWENGMLNHRWFTGVLGDDCGFAAITAQSAAGRLVRTGYLCRRGTVIHATEVDVIAYLEPDGLTHRGGRIRLTLAQGEVLEIRCKARAGVAFQRGTVVMVEMMCEVEGAGLQGYCDAEISTNPRNGKGPVQLALNATTAEGFSAYAPLDLPA
jgi:hypothetical protein